MGEGFGIIIGFVTGVVVVVLLWPVALPLLLIRDRGW